MEIDEYKNDGWGISKLGFEKIYDIISYNIEKDKKFKVIEFGSGTSTKFFVDLHNELNNIEITSFDNDLKYSYKGKHDFLKLHISDLVECDDIIYDSLFENKKFKVDLMSNKKTPLTTRQKNNFYNISDELNGYYDFVLLDGPNGNGRTLSYLHLLDHVKSGTIFFIDDYVDHDIHEKFKLLYPNSEVIYENNKSKINQWDNGGDFIIYKIR